MKSRSLRQGTLVRGLGLLGTAALVALTAVTAIEGCKGKAKGGDPGAKGEPAPSSSPPPAAPKLVSFAVLPAPVGHQIRGSRKSTMKLAVEFWQEGQKLGSNDSTRVEEYTRTVEVLGLVGAAPAKIRVRYDQYHLTETHPDKPAVDQSQVAGHSYLLNGAEGAVEVLGDHGQPVTPAEQDTLKNLHGDLGQDDPFVTALGPRPIPVGKSVPMREGLFRALVNTGNGEFKSGTVVLSGTRSENGRLVAIFDWSAEMSSSEENGLEITWHLKGQAIVGVSPAVTLRATVEGALDVSGHTVQNGARADIAGDGSFKDERTVTP